MFLNISKVEIKKVYYTISPNKYRNINQPSNINIVDLSTINKKLIFLFDVETDGLIKNDNFPNIVQISWAIMYFEGIVYKKVTELVNSDFNSNSDAFKINNLNPEIIKKIGMEPSEVYQDIIYDLKH